MEYIEALWAAVAAVAGYVLARVRNADSASIKGAVRAVAVGVGAALDAADHSAPKKNRTIR